MTLHDLTTGEQAILALLAMSGEPMGRQRILEHLMAAGLPLPEGQWTAELERLRARELVLDVGFVQALGPDPDPNVES